MDIQVETRPRIHMLVTDAVSGEQRRRTEYIGDDPSGAPAWVHLQQRAFSSWPCAIAYRIVAVTPTGAIAV